MLTIRPATDSDRDAIWSIFQAVISTGDAYVFEPGTSRDVALAYWFDPKHRCYVAEQNGRVVGSYFIQPNQPGLGSHIANASYMVAPTGRGGGVGHAMGEHSLSEARQLGYRGMQFNIVVSTNGPAVRLWKRLGFEIIATVPGAFRHATQGFVDTYILFRSLDQ